MSQGNDSKIRHHHQHLWTNEHSSPFFHQQHQHSCFPEECLHSVNIKKKNMSKNLPKTHITKQKCCNRKGFSHCSPTHPSILTSSVEKTSHLVKSLRKGKS